MGINARTFVSTHFPRNISMAASVDSKKAQVSLGLLASSACTVSVKLAEEYFQENPRTFSMRFLANSI